MPEFEESDSQPDPTHSYTPGTGTPNNKGGRRRSGGFKSEVPVSNSKIGEVDPVEALKTEVQKSTPPSVDPVEALKTEVQKSTPPSDNAIKPQNDSSTKVRETKKPSGEKAQPSQATLDSIQKVEEKIAQRRAEIEKDRPSKERRSPRKPNGPKRKNGQNVEKGGLIASIGRFFGSLFGNSAQSDPKVDTGLPPRKHKSQSNNRSHRNGSGREGASGKRYNNRRNGSNNRGKNTSKNY